MGVLRAVLVALAAASVIATSVAAAGTNAMKQRVQIDLKIDPGNTFVLAPLQSGALKRDSGTLDCPGDYDKGQVLRNGQESWPWVCRALVLTGKRGTLVLRSQFAWIDAGGRYNIATGTWKVVRGTGQYARVTGSGQSATVGVTNGISLARYQGYLNHR